MRKSVLLSVLLPGLSTISFAQAPVMVPPDQTPPPAAVPVDQPNPSRLSQTATGTAQYNGIVLPAVWPPMKSPTQVYTVPFYIAAPPAVIPIDVGRQLFVDDFLIGATNLVRVAHHAQMYAGNPVLRPGGSDSKNYAFPFSDGAWFDPADKTFKAWYYGGYGNMISYATSQDGITWTKPAVGIPGLPGNMVLQIGGQRDSSTTWMDLNDVPAKKFKAFPVDVPSLTIGYYTSPDGEHWVKQPNVIKTFSDRDTVFYNPFRKVWVNSTRAKITLPATPSRAAYLARARFYSESADLLNWTPLDITNGYWTGPDNRMPGYYSASPTPPELYTLDATPYESVMVGLFSWYYPWSNHLGPDIVEIGSGFSRDGFNWVMPARGGGPNNALIPASNTLNTWNIGNTQSAGGGFLVVGDNLYFYFSGRASYHGNETNATPMSTGLATLRRDGFFSLDAGATAGTLVTRVVKFSGSHLFVNVADKSGTLKAEVLDQTGNVIAPFSAANSDVLIVDSTIHEITWKGQTLSAVANTPVKLKFYLTNGSLYSFWVTPDANGASHGYVAAGGPGFTGATDTVGNTAVVLPPPPPPRFPSAGRKSALNSTATNPQ